MLQLDFLEGIFLLGNMVQEGFRVQDHLRALEPRPWKGPGHYPFFLRGAAGFRFLEVWLIFTIYNRHFLLKNQD